MKTRIDDYSIEVTCVYRGRVYRVRDNGAVYRQCKENYRRSKLDEEWTFGKFNPNTGYMLIGQERVHRIVCTAYHGEPVGEQNIVDHIDTNRCNNRPENLRWVTKLENVLLNPITLAKVELICGSVEEFLANPSLLNGHESENQNFTWMRAVTKDEAEHSLKRWKEWADKPIEDRKSNSNRSSLGEWLFSKEEYNELAEWNGGQYGLGAHPVPPWEQQKAKIEEENRRFYEQEYGLKESKTPGAKQLKWKTPTEFLLCPQEEGKRDLQSYLNNLVKGRLFSKTDFGDGGKVMEAGYNSEDDALYVLVSEATPVKPYALTKISFEDGYFIHENQGTFFHEDGGLKYFTLAMGKEWTEGDVFDDYC